MTLFADENRRKRAGLKAGQQAREEIARQLEVVRDHFTYPQPDKPETPWQVMTRAAEMLRLPARPDTAPQGEGERAALKALDLLERAASEVARYGAQTGPQWTKLSSALIQSRATLKTLSRPTLPEGGE